MKIQKSNVCDSRHPQFAAYHEAGHIVVALSLGAKVYQAHIIGNQRGKTVSGPPQANDERDLTVCQLAKFYGGVWGANEIDPDNFGSGKDGDIKLADDVLREYQIETDCLDDEDLEELQKEASELAEHLILENRQLLHELAQKLFSRKRINRKQILDVWNKYHEKKAEQPAKVVTQ